MTPREALRAALPRLTRIAREAQNTYVGRHWPTMAEMRKDGIGFGLVEDAAHERFIRRYLDTFQPEFVLDLLSALATPEPPEPSVSVEAAWEALTMHDKMTAAMALLITEHRPAIEAAVRASVTPPPLDDLGAAWAEAEAAAAAAQCWFIVTTVEGMPGIVTIEARRWIDPHPIEEPARIWRQPLAAALRSLVTRLSEAHDD